MTRFELRLTKKEKKKKTLKKWALVLGTTVGLPLLGGFLDAFGAAFGTGVGEACLKFLQHLIIS